MTTVEIMATEYQVGPHVNVRQIGPDKSDAGEWLVRVTLPRGDYHAIRSVAPLSAALTYAERAATKANELWTAHEKLTAKIDGFRQFVAREEDFD